MPVTAKLSRAFYEALGDDVANELVDWFNAVDLTYRAQLRELNESNWERFRAVTASKADLERFATKADLERFAARVEDRFATKADLERLATKAYLERFATKADLERFATKADLERFATKADLERFATKAELAEVKAELMKWMFVLWAATVAPLAGLIVALHTVFAP